MPLTSAQEQHVREQLRQGVAAYRIAQTTGWPNGAIRRVRDQMGIPPIKPDERLRRHVPEQVLIEEAEDGGTGRTDVRIVEPGVAWLERPNQARWLALVATAVRPMDFQVLHRAVCRVLGLPKDAFEDEVVDALIAERRPADELARLYLDARKVA